jgi:hypothetical protein
MGWIEQIANGINKTFNAIRPAFPTIPAILLVCEARHRPGLSAIALTSAIIQRLPEVGIETGVNCDGSPNKINGFVRVMVEEIVKHIKNYGYVRVSTAPGEMNLQVTGVVTPTGEVVGTAINMQPIVTNGISG